MAVYPQRIVLKNSKDGDAYVSSQIRPGGAEEIVDGEVVVSQRPGAATLYTKDAVGNVVAVGAEDRNISVFPSVFDDFEGGPNVTPQMPGNNTAFIDPNEDLGLGGAGTKALKLRFGNWIGAKTHGLQVGFYPWTVEMWVKGSSDPEKFPADPEEDVSDPANYWADFCIVGGIRDYYSGPGAFSIYLDAGLPSEGGKGTSTSNTDNQVFGSICFGLNPGITRVQEDDLIPPTGEIVSSRSVTVLDDAWHHVVFQHEGRGSYACFVDGVLIERKQLNSAIDHNNLGPRDDITLPGQWTLGRDSERIGEDAYRINPLHEEFWVDSFAIWEYVAKYPGRHEYDVPTTSIAYELVGQPLRSLQNLFDTNIPDVIADGSVMVWDEPNNYWRVMAAPAANISGSNLGQLGNVELDADGLITDRSVLSWSATDGEWQNRPILLEDTDVVTSNKDIGYVIKYNGLVWNAATLNWIDIPDRPTNLSDFGMDLSLGQFDINELRDVDLAKDKALEVDDVMLWDGDHWIAAAQPPANLVGNSITDLGDVAQLGSNAPDAGSVLVYDSTNSEFVTRKIDYSEIENAKTTLNQFGNSGSDAEKYLSNNLMGSITPLNTLKDVTYAEGSQSTFLPEEGQMLIWRTDQWVNEYGPPANISFSKIAELSDVTNTYSVAEPYTGGELSIDNVSALAFKHPVAPNGITFNVEYFGGQSAGVQLATFRETDNTGTAVRVSRTEGVDLRADINFFRLRGKPDVTTNRPELRFESGDSMANLGEYISFKLPLGLSETTTYILPDGDGDASDVLATDGQGNLSWIARNANNSLGVLDDVDLGTTSPATGNALVYRSDIAMWVPGVVNDVDLATSSVGDMSDVDLTSVADGQALLWNSTAGQFEPGDAAPDLSTQSIDELQDVNTSAASNGDVLAWNSSANQWRPVATAVADFTQLTNLPTAISGGTFGSG